MIYMNLYVFFATHSKTPHLTSFLDDENKCKEKNALTQKITLTRLSTAQLWNGEREQRSCPASTYITTQPSPVHCTYPSSPIYISPWTRFYYRKKAEPKVRVRKISSSPTRRKIFGDACIIHEKALTKRSFFLQSVWFCSIFHTFAENWIQPSPVSIPANAMEKSAKISKWALTGQALFASSWFFCYSRSLLSVFSFGGFWFAS